MCKILVSLYVQQSFIIHWVSSLPFYLSVLRWLFLPLKKLPTFASSVAPADLSAYSLPHWPKTFEGSTAGTPLPAVHGHPFRGDISSPIGQIFRRSGSSAVWLAAAGRSGEEASWGSRRASCPRALGWCWATERERERLRQRRVWKPEKKKRVRNSLKYWKY